MSSHQVNDHIPASAAPSGPGNSSAGLNAANFEEFE